MITVAVGMGRVAVGLVKGFCWVFVNLLPKIVATLVVGVFAFQTCCRVVFPRDRDTTFSVACGFYFSVVAFMAAFGSLIAGKLSLNSVVWGIPVKYIALGLLLTNLISLFYEIGRIGKKDESDSDEEKDPEITDPDDFDSMYDKITNLKSVSKEQKENFCKEISELHKKDKITLNELCALKELIENAARNTVQPLPSN